MRNPDLYIDITANRGRGVFCIKNLPANTVIEVAPVIVMTDADRRHLDETLLHDYIFEWTPDTEKKCCMALGYVPMYNHSYASNCEYFMDYDTDTIMIKTVRDIKADEEVTINYNGDWNDSRPVWFDVSE
ncbi:MAG: SET domain-containing protein-lysine N-methyltransferase [Sphingobacteriales bacterium]|nr:MAG: SET domain-containing protein-lysine N-methyltransferase [Sphingobacteriales bacterium]